MKSSWALRHLQTILFFKPFCQKSTSPGTASCQGHTWEGAEMNNIIRQARVINLKKTKQNGGYTYMPSLPTYVSGP
jgi:hypothetical protein